MRNGLGVPWCLEVCPMRMGRYTSGTSLAPCYPRTLTHAGWEAERAVRVRHRRTRFHQRAIEILGEYQIVCEPTYRERSPRPR